MTTCKQLVVPILHGTKLSKEDCPKSPIEMEDMSHIPYVSVVSSLMYAMAYTRQNIVQAMGVLSQYMDNPRRVHWDAIKRVFRYLRGTSDYFLCFQGNSFVSHCSTCIRGYVDLDWAGDIDSRRSTSGYVFMMSGGAISWMSK